MAGFALIQAQLDIIDLLTDNWTSANTGGITPTIDKPIDEASLDLNNNDYVLVDMDVELSNPLGVYAAESRSDIPISINLWTAQKGSSATSEYLHMSEMINEVGRIIKANPRLNGYAMFYPQRVHNSDKTSRLNYHFVIDCILVKANP